MLVQEKGDNSMEKNKRLERKITRWYGSGIGVREWVARHWEKFLIGENMFPINEPKGFAEIAEYCYHKYKR